MKILFLTPRIPYPPLKGDQAIAYNRLRTLGAKHDITLLTFVSGNDDPRAEEALRPYCSRIIKVPHPKWKVFWNLMSRGVWSKLPLQVLYYRSSSFQKAVNELLEEEFDLIHTIMLRLLPYVERQRKPVLLECIDSMQLNLSRQVEVTTGLRRWVYREELRRMRAYEPTVDEHVEQVIFVSPIDAKASGSRKTLVLPLGVEVHPPVEPCQRPIVVFSGNMGYSPNIIAAEWFVRNCWAAVREAVPNATFRVLGGNPGPSILEMRNIPGVEILGHVDNMMSAISEAAVSVAPMQSGSGMQFKILEAMACGLPVVATSLGLGAIRATSGTEVLIADDKEMFSKTVINLLRNPNLRATIGGYARSFVETFHTWDYAAHIIEQKYYQISKSRI